MTSYNKKQAALQRLQGIQPQYCLSCDMLIRNVYFEIWGTPEQRPIVYCYGCIDKHTRDSTRDHIIRSGLVGTLLGIGFGTSLLLGWVSLAIFQVYGPLLFLLAIVLFSPLLLVSLLTAYNKGISTYLISGRYVKRRVIGDIFPRHG